MEGTNDNSEQNPLKSAEIDISSMDKIVKAYETALKSNLELLKGLQDIDKQVFSIAKNFGFTNEATSGLIKSTTLATDELVKYGATQETAYKQQLAIGQTLGRNVILSVDAQKDLFLATKNSGIEAGKLAGAFKDAGISLFNVGENTNKIINAAREMGVNANAVTNAVVTNVKMLNQYNFEGGVSGLAKMAANAAMLRVDMKDTFNFAEKIYNPEGAIQMASALQRLGVTQSALLDPLKALDLAENDPTELQNQIAQLGLQFGKLNEQGNFELFSYGKRQLRELAKETNIPFDSLVKMTTQTAELDSKLSKIQFPTELFKNEEQKKQFANLTELKDGKVMIDVNGTLQDVNKVLSEQVAGKKNVDELLQSLKPKTAEQLANAQLGATERLTIAIESLKNIAPRALARTDGGQAILNLSVTSMEKLASVLGTQIKVGTDKVIPEINKFAKDIQPDLDKLIKGEGGLSDLITVFGKVGDTFKNIGEKLDGLIKPFNDSILNLGENFNSKGLKDSMEKLKKSFDDYAKQYPESKQFIDEAKKKLTGNDVLVTKDSEIQLNPEDTFVAGTGLGFLKDLIKPNSQPALIESISATLGIDSNKMRDMVKQTSEVSSVKNQSPTEVTINFKMSLDVSGTNSQSIDTNKLIMVLNDQGVKEKLVQVTREVLTERGQKIMYPS